MRFLVALVLLAACGGDDAAAHDAGSGSGSDAANGVDPVPVAFAQVTSAFSLPPQDFVRGPDGRIYADEGGPLVASSDNGVTWTSVTTNVGAPAATSTSLFVVANAGPTVKRTTNGAAFTDLVVPGVLAGTRMVIAATPTVLWAETQSGVDNSKLYRSTNQGDAFASITPPTNTSALLIFTTGGEYVFLHDSTGHIWRTMDGATWDDLGTPVAMTYPYVAASAAGTVFVGNQRRAVADATWSTVGTTNLASISQRPNGELVRVGQQGGAVETSSTDGVTWSATSIPTIAACSVGVMAAFDAVVLAQCLDGSQQSLMRLPVADTAWSRDEPDTLPAAFRAVDISFTSAGRILVASTDRIFVSDDGSHWRRLYTPPDGWPIRALAVSPNGQRIYVGSIARNYAFLDGNGTVTASSLMPIDTTEVANAAQWMSDTIVWVTTSSSDDTKGHLLNGDPDRIGTWELVNPNRNETDPQFIATVGYHGVEACGPLAVGARQFYSAQAWDAELRVRFQPSDPFTSVMQPFSPLPVRSMSCAPNGTHSFVVGDSVNSFLYVGNLIGPKFAPVMTSDLPGDLLVARFSPDNHLWVITEQGFFRSTDAVDGH